VSQVQIRTLCPEWLKVKAKDSSVAAATAHHGNCPQSCGWGVNECWVYRFVDLAELRDLLDGPTPAEQEQQVLEEIRISDDELLGRLSPRKRGRKLKTPAQSSIPITPQELQDYPGVDPLDDDNLDDLL